MGPAQGLTNVIDAAEMLSDIPNLQFILIGGGIDLEKLLDKVKRMKLTNVKFISRQPIETMPSIYALSDVLLVHLTNDPLFEITIPGKTQSCLLAGRPIIMSVNGDASELIKKSAAGLTVCAMDSKALEMAVRKIYSLSLKDRIEMGKSGRQFYFNNLSPSVQVEKYENLFKLIKEEKNV